MSFMDIVKQYIDPTPDAAATSPQHFDQVARSAPPDVLGRGVSEALRSDRTPPFPEMVGDLFGRSDPHRQAGLLNQILAAAGPGVLSGAAGGLLSRVLGGATGAGSSTAPTVTAEQASQLTPSQVGQIAAQAESENPGIIDQVGKFYGQHPDLVKGLGGMALAVLLGKMASR